MSPLFKNPPKNDQVNKVLKLQCEKNLRVYPNHTHIFKPCRKSLQSLKKKRSNLQEELRTQDITKTRLFKYIENFTSKNWKLLDKITDIFHISAQNIDYGTR